MSPAAAYLKSCARRRLTRRIARGHALATGLAVLSAILAFLFSAAVAAAACWHWFFPLERIPFLP